MPAEPVGKIRVSNFGGLDTENSPWTMDPRDAADLLNVETRDGKIKKRPAFANQFTAAIGGDAARTEWVKVIQTNSLPQMIASIKTATNRQIMKTTAISATASWSDMGDIAGVGVNTDTYPKIVGDRLIISPASTNGYVHCETTSHLATLSGSPPAGVMLEEYNRMGFLAPDTGVGITNFSAIDSTDSWTSSDTLTHGTRNGIMFGAVNMGDWLLEAGVAGLFRITGYGRETLGVSCINDCFGVSGYKHLCKGKNGEAYGLVVDARTGGIYYKPYISVIRISSDGSIEEVAKKIATKVDLMGGGNLEPSAAWVEYDPISDRLFVLHRYCEYHAGNGGKQIYVMNNGNWFKWTTGLLTLSSVTSPGCSIPVSSQYISNSVVFVGLGMAAGGSPLNDHDYALKLDPTASLDTYPKAADAAQTEYFSSYWTTPIYRVYEEDVSDVIRWVYVYGQQTSGTAIKVEYQVDNNGTWVVCGGTGSTWALTQNGIRVPIGVRGRTIQFRFTFDTTAVAPEIDGFVIGFTPVSNRG